MKDLFDTLFRPSFGPSEARYLLNLFKEQERRDNWHVESEEIASLHYLIRRKLRVLSRAQPILCEQGHELPEGGDYFVAGKLKKDACKVCQLEKFSEQNAKRREYRRDWKRRRKAEGTMARGA